MGVVTFVGASCDRHGQPSIWLTADKREFLTKIADTARRPVSGWRRKFPSYCFKVNLTARLAHTEFHLYKYISFVFPLYLFSTNFRLQRYYDNVMCVCFLFFNWSLSIHNQRDYLRKVNVLVWDIESFTKNWWILLEFYNSHFHKYD